MQMSVNGRRRVVITGLGAVSPLGNDVETTWQNLLAGESGAGPITHFDSDNFFVHFACELKDFDPGQWIDHKQARRMDRFAQMIVAAARQAEADSGIDIAKEGDRIGASVATGIGGLQSYQDCYDTLLQKGPTRVNPFAIPCIIPNMGAGWVSMELGTRGPLASQCTACAASDMAIGDGTDQIQLGRADIMLCGGTEAAIPTSLIARSEEHTSELQSLAYLVCRLLLEKKKKTMNSTSEKKGVDAKLAKKSRFLCLEALIVHSIELDFITRQTNPDRVQRVASIFSISVR